MIKKKDRAASEVNASSMADIAFLLLIFFIITTNVAQKTGVKLILPIKQEDVQVDFLDRNVCTIYMNSNNDLLVEKKEMKLEEVTEFVKEFITNNGVDIRYSVSPQDAIVLFKYSRGAKYDAYLALINQVQQAYFEIWAEKQGVPVSEFISWDLDNDKAKSEQMDKLREIIPYNFSVSQID